MPPTATTTHLRPAIHVTEADFDQLSELLEGIVAPSPGATLLAQEMERATIVGPHHRGQPFVRLNSIVAYEDVGTGHRRHLRVVLPHEANLEDQSISVLSPAGAALLGLRAGQTMHWRVTDGRTRTLKVLFVGDGADRQGAVLQGEAPGRVSP